MLLVSRYSLMEDPQEIMRVRKEQDDMLATLREHLYNDSVEDIQESI